MEPPSDPWDWTMDDVVEQFCRRRSLLDKRPNAMFPEPTVFEQKIRENGIDGSTLLLDVDKASLKELGITKLGELSAIQYAVQLLRRRSGQYEWHVRNELGQSTNYMHAESCTPAISPSQGNHQRRFPWTPAPVTPAPVTSAPITPAPITPNPLKRQPSQEIVPKQAPPVEHPGKAVSYRPSTRNTYVEGGSDRKRRRLELPSSFQPTQGSPAPKNSIAASPLEKILRIPTRAQICGVEATDRFLARNKLLVDEIFFGQTKYGQELNVDVDTRIISDSQKPHGFVELLPSNQINIAGHQNYVYRQLLHFFNGSVSAHVEYNQQKAQLITPYRSSLVTKDHSRSHILLNRSEHPLRTIRIDESDLYIRSGYGNTDYEDWDFIRRLSKNKDVVLPAYGESNFDEEEYDSSFIEELESNGREEEEEEVGDTAKKGMLTKVAISEIINKRIDYFIQDWSKRKLPLREATAWRLWKEGKSAKDRIWLRKFSETQIQSLTQRLEKLCADITDQQWSKEDDIRRQCESLQRTVVSREEERFKVKIWQEKKAPHRPTSFPRTRKKRTASVHASDGSGILLSSESEIPSDDLNNFIEHDETPTKTKPPMDPRPTFDVLLDGGAGELQFDGGVPSPKVDTIADTSDMELDHDSRAGLGTLRPSTTKPETPKPKHSGNNIIDLTQATSDSDDAPVVRKYEHETSLKQPSEHTLNGVGKNPESEPDDAVLLWSSQDLENKNDRKRLIIKLLRTLPQVEYDELRDYLSGDSPQEVLKDDIILAIRAFVSEKHRIPGFNERDSGCATKAAILFVCWYHCSSHFSDMKILPKDVSSDILTKVNDKEKELMLFCQFVCKILREHRLPVKPHIHSGPKEEPSILSEESDGLEVIEASQSSYQNKSHHKKRKRVVKESQTAKHKREKAKQHQESQEQRAKLVLQQLDSGLIDPGDGIVINPGKSDDHDFIFLDPHIAKRIHNHQVEGLRFLWREIIASSSDKANMQGALLSHTMGLGKTMQAISLLVTIAQAAASKNNRISSQIPPSLQKSRTLIICPSALIANWIDEFAKWLPENTSHLLGDLFSIQTESASENRLMKVARWYQKGGILLISYDIFRSYVTNNKAAKLTYDTHEVIKQQLLEGPRIVIVDEAHKLKNPNSEIGKAASHFKTLSRIALTGSPLSNNLEEYFAMIDWVAPGYLGDRTEFKANFEEPIREGGYVDSSSTERRKAIKKLKVLEDVTDPKIHRRDVTVLRGSLKPKTEFVITVPLTEIQAEMYHAYVKGLKAESDTQLSSTRIFNWLSMLGLLCNHPFSFQTKLRERKEQLTQKKAKSSAIQSPGSTDSNTTPPSEQNDLINKDTDNDKDIPESSVSIPTIIELESILKKIQHSVKHSKHSYRTKLLMQILKKSKKVGDRVLVFSQSIPTLDYLEDLFRRTEKKYIRLDGNTKMSERASYLKQFNRGKFDIFLISTKAGGLGFNLPAANRVVIFDFSFNPQWEEQAIGRAYRIGQEKPVFVYRFIAGGTFEEKLFNQAVFKTQLAFKVVEKKNTKNIAQRKMDYFFKPKAVSQEDLVGHKGKDTVLDEILNELAAKSSEEYYIRKIIAAETLQDPSDEILTAEDQQEIRQMIADEQLRKENPAAWRAKQNAIMKAQTSVPQVPPADNYLNPPLLQRTNAIQLPLPTNTAPAVHIANAIPLSEGAVDASTLLSHTPPVIPTTSQSLPQAQNVSVTHAQSPAEAAGSSPGQNSEADTNEDAQAEKFGELSKIHTAPAQVAAQEINQRADSEHVNHDTPKRGSEGPSLPSPINLAKEGLSAHSERSASLPLFEDLFIKRH